MIWSLAEKMPFSWGLLPVLTWLSAAKVHFENLRDALGEIDTNEDIRFGIFHGFRERTTVRRYYWKPLCDWLQDQLFPNRPASSGELQLARNNKAFMSQQIDEAEQALQGRHDADETWPQSSEAYRLINSEKFPAKYRFSRLENFYRPVRYAPFVAAHVCMYGITPTEALIYELRLIRAFDPEWFDTAYAIALTLGLANLSTETMK